METPFSFDFKLKINKKNVNAKCSCLKVLPAPTELISIHLNDVKFK